MMQELLPILFALTVALATWGIWQLARGTADRYTNRISRRLGSAQPGQATMRQSAILTPRQEGGPTALLVRLPLLQRMAQQVAYAYPDVSLARFICTAAGIALLASLFAYLVFPSLLIALVAGLLAGYMPFLMVSNRRTQRQALFASQLPEALDFLSRVLRAGHSLSTGLQMMGDELPAPLSAEFRRCHDQHSVGQPLDDSLKEMATRIDSTDFAFFITAVLIQRQTGGDLAEVLDHISDMIRQRIRLQQQVRAKTAEGRLTGNILVAFPAVMFLIAYVLNPDYARVLLHTSTGLMMLATAGLLQVAGLIAIRKVTTVRY